MAVKGLVVNRWSSGQSCGIGWCVLSAEAGSVDFEDFGVQFRLHLPGLFVPGHVVSVGFGMRVRIHSGC